MTSIHTNASATQPSYAANPSGTAGVASAGATPPAPKEINATSLDALMAEVLAQSTANPAAALEPPPTTTPASVATAANSLSTISADDQAMSIEALLDLVAKEMKKAGLNSLESSLKAKGLAYQKAQAAQIAAANATRAKKGAVMAEAATMAATGFAASLASGFATYNRPNADGSDGKKGWSAGGDISAGLFKGAGEMGASEFKQEQLELDAQGAELSALATTHQKMAETTLTEGSTTATQQIQSAQETMSKNEQGRRESAQNISRL